MKMFRLLLITFLITHGFSTSVMNQSPTKFDPALDSYWEAYKSTYNKSYYDVTEETNRRSVWEDNAEYIRRHNRETDTGKRSFWLGMNQYGDLTAEEYYRLIRVNIQSPETFDTPVLAHASMRSDELPAAVDWREEGYVTAVKNQLQCGACWAFAAVAALESQHAKKTGKLVSLSEQNLIDCQITANNGCLGGVIRYAYEYCRANGGLDTENAYPYAAQKGQCHFNTSNVGATCSGYVQVTRGSEGALQAAVAGAGPVAAGIDALHRSFQFYRQGVYYEPQCSTVKLIHAVTVVGYGTERGQDYWLVKNSFGPSWGDSGYIKMARNRDNNCGIATQAVYPLV